MKNNILKFFLFAMVVVGIASCSKSKDASPETTALNSLNGSWVAAGGYVKVDGMDVSFDYTNFKITFSETTSGQKIYTVENGSKAFLNITTDTWAFSGTTFNQIVRGRDGIVMTSALADGFMTLTFTLPDPYAATGGRTKGLFGAFEMKLKKG